MAVRTKRLTLAALFTALGILLPLAFHLTGIPAAGQIFLPMHIPVLLCGLILARYTALSAVRYVPSPAFF